MEKHNCMSFFSVFSLTVTVSTVFIFSLRSSIHVSFFYIVYFTLPSYFFFFFLVSLYLSTSPILSAWRPEYGSWMVEATPGIPYGGDTLDLRHVEANMAMRYVIYFEYFSKNISTTFIPCCIKFIDKALFFFHCLSFYLSFSLSPDDIVFHLYVPLEYFQ